METLKKLKNGDLSLAVTYWVFVFLSNTIFSVLAAISVAIANYYPIVGVLILLVVVILNITILCMAASGIWYKIKRGKTVWNIVAFIFTLLPLFSTIGAIMTIIRGCF